MVNVFVVVAFTTLLRCLYSLVGSYCEDAGWSNSLAYSMYGDVVAEASVRNDVRA